MAKITEDTRDEMFQFWCVYKPKYGWEKAIQEVARRCQICERTVRKYKALDEWDKRLEAIQLQTRAGIDYDIGKEAKKNLKILQAAKGKYVEAIRNAGKPDTIKCPYCTKTITFINTLRKISLKDITELIRTELLLVGEPDSRAGFVDETEKRENIIGILEGIKSNGKQGKK